MPTPYIIDGIKYIGDRRVNHLVNEEYEYLQHECLDLDRWKVGDDLKLDLYGDTLEYFTIKEIGGNFMVIGEDFK